jgi:hypothetical protein
MPVQTGIQQILKILDYRIRGSDNKRINSPLNLRDRSAELTTKPLRLRGQCFCCCESGKDPDHGTGHAGGKCAGNERLYAEAHDLITPLRRKAS